MLAGLMLQGVTPVHKGLTPYGKKCTLVVLLYGNKFAYLNFFQSLQQVCAPAHCKKTRPPDNTTSLKDFLSLFDKC